MIIPIAGSVAPRCEVCGSPFRGKSYRWKIRNKSTRVCQTCDSDLKMQASKAPTGRNAELRQVQKSSGVGAIIFLVLIVFALTIFYFATA